MPNKSDRIFALARMVTAGWLLIAASAIIGSVARFIEVVARWFQP